MQTRYLEPEAVAMVANALKGHSRTIWLLMNEVGLRISDAVKIKHCHISLDGVLWWTSSKTGKTASRKLSGELLLLLDPLEDRPNTYIFQSKSRKAEHIHRSTVYRHIKKACKKIGMDPEGIGTHSARKSFAVKDFRENGLGRTMFDLQHSSAATTLLYALSDNPIPRILKKISLIDEEIQELYDICDMICNELWPPDEPVHYKLKEEKNAGD